ncbi:NADP-dependent oxidoreductase [Leucobacter weissii]|uniref:NADP-dependent oxidoreductase n=2 Tax=Leucobacter weissii TaxID=1983706 RepID=A0A939MIC0_9MICO|nr:NADP-dependent oxidoreductase [Leucobacter weissii]
MPDPDDFIVVEQPVPALQRGAVLVENSWFSLDPSMRIRMSGGESSYFAPYRIGAPLDGWAVGTVVESSNPDFTVGDTLHHACGWREHAVLVPDGSDWTSPRPVGVGGAIDARHHLSVLGASGFTAWAGLFKVAQLGPGETVFVSAAAGAVGSLAVQFAKLRGARVIASAGTSEKVRRLTGALGADAAFDYRTRPIGESLRSAAPDGIDVYFDSVGAEHLDAALESLRPGGRVALCGQIENYNHGTGASKGVTRLFSAIEKGLTLRGFLARMYTDDFGEFRSEVSHWFERGMLTVDETVIDGLENAPQGFIGMLGGANIGKTLVRLQAEA